VSDADQSAEENALEPVLTSGVVSSPADALLREAIAIALAADPSERQELFESLLREIECFMKEFPQDRPWTYMLLTGTDGSKVFRGGTGRSVVIDPSGAIWRARSYEDFDTTYQISDNECSITSLTPKYEQMSRY